MEAGRGPWTRHRRGRSPHQGDGRAGPDRLGQLDADTRAAFKSARGVSPIQYRRAMPARSRPAQTMTILAGLAEYPNKPNTTALQSDTSSLLLLKARRSRP